MEPATPTPRDNVAVTVRRTHTKSRKGCTNCKRRKVKCDESHPTCFNCQRHGVPCSLSASPATGARVASPSPAAISPLTPQTRDDGDSQHSGNNTTPGLPPSHSEAIAPLAPHELRVKDFELMHHWCTATADTVSIRHDLIYVWKIAMPRIGYQHPFVMHGLLSLAAAHKAYLLPNDRRMYLALADYHQTVGSEVFRPLLKDLRPEMWKSIFCFASVVTLFTFSRPVRSEFFHLGDPVLSLLEVIGVLRGVKTTLAPMLNSVLRSELAPMVYGVFPGEESGSNERTANSLANTLLPPDIWDALKALRSSQEEDLPSASLKYYHEAMDSLEECINLVVWAGIYVEPGVVMYWMHSVDDSIFVDVHAYRPHAILLLGYFSIFLALLEKNFWYARGWARQLISEIEVRLSGHQKLLELFQWPKQKVLHLYNISA